MRRSLSLLAGLVVLLAFCAIPVTADTSAAAGTDVISGITKAPPVYGDVRQGEVDSHRYYVPSGHTTLEVSLQWDDTPTTDLSLTIYPPNGNPLIWNDESDGLTDGEISLSTPLPSQMTGAYWSFDVTGVSVSGTQSYTLVINSYS